MRHGQAACRVGKLGVHLKVDDAFLCHVNEEGQEVNVYHSWKVVEFLYVDSLSIDSRSDA